MRNLLSYEAGFSHKAEDIPAGFEISYTERSIITHLLPDVSYESGS